MTLQETNRNKEAQVRRPTTGASSALARRATLDVKVANGFMFEALRAENPGALAIALRMGADAGAVDGDRFPLAVAAAAESEAAALIEALLAAGAYPRQADSNGSTALHAAAIHGCAEAVAPLAFAGADVDARDIQGDTPLLIACRRARGQNRSAATAIELIDARANLEWTDAKGRTALLIAAGQNCAPLVHRLLELGADLGARDQLDQDVTFWAIEAVAPCGEHSRRASPDALRELCAHAARRITQSDELCRAARLDWFEACVALLDAGANPDASMDVRSWGWRLNAGPERKSARELAAASARQAFSIFDAEAEAVELRRALGDASVQPRPIADLVGLPSADSLHASDEG
ncbi:ankyrin repeat domain-containing protein [Burkholderia vietnamiensis]|uniref:FOG domain containing protein n=1 Tax=Burkholderia vietnamiensis (strain G4 / LMG 22486) TaxID=269482 RepID=A4JFV3_BURVG|nr:FOG domain containing protein [Burkholderia vietnamiensis G4]MCB4344912.1 ankyrin repeat domain-containing protein [Burkholderia vietnamiensis]